MPISNEQAQAYARRFNEDPDFNAALRRARQCLDRSRADHVYFYMNRPISPDIGIDEFQLSRLSRADMEQIDRALAGTLRETLTRNAVRTQAIGELAAQQQGTEARYQETPQPETHRETPSMNYAIPHPLVDFDESTEFVFFESANGGTPSYQRLDAPHAGPSNLLVYLYGKFSPSTRDGRLANLQFPDRDTNRSPFTLHLGPMRIGIPISRRLKQPQDRIDEHDLIADEGMDHLLYWQTFRRMCTVHHRNNQGPTEPQNDWWIIGQTPEPVHTYFTVTGDPVTSVPEAWERCSESFKAWAKRQGMMDLDHLLFMTMQVWPHAFGLTTAEQFRRIWALPQDGSAFWAAFLPKGIAYSLILAQAQFDPDNKNMTLHRNVDDLLRGRTTTMRTGKALRAILDKECYDDEQIKRYTASIIGELTPPEFRIGFTKADFDNAYTNGPSSCMTYERSRYWLLKDGDAPADVRPTDALINGDIGIAVMEAGGKVTARTLVIESTKKFVRIYTADYANPRNDGTALRAKLNELGYEEDSRALVGQRLVKLPLIEASISTGFTAMAQDIQRYLADIGERHLGRSFSLDEAQRIRDAMSPMAYVLPYLDHGNFACRVHEDHIEVLPAQEDFGSSVAANLQFAFIHDKRPGTVCRSSYEAGGTVAANIDAGVDAIMEIIAEHQPKQAVPKPEPESSTQPAQPVPPDTQQFTCDWGERLADACQAIIDGRTGEELEGEPITHIFDSMSGEILDYTLVESEVPELAGRMGTVFFRVEHPNGTMVWVERDQVSYDADGEAFITDLAEAYGLIWCENENDWYHEDVCVQLHDSTYAHEDNCVYVEGVDEYYLRDDDDIVYCERDACYYLGDDCCFINDCEYALRVECYRLPDGSYIHRDDLESAA